MQHLIQSSKEIALLGAEERINHILSERWVGYTKGREILNKLNDLLNHPPSHRMPNLLIVGETNNGKTVLVNRFFNQHPAYTGDEIEGVRAPVLLIQAPPVPDEKRFYNIILDKVFAPFKINERIEKKHLQVIQVLKKTETRMLIIDEIHHIIAGNLNKQRAFLNVIKYLGNELKISIVGVGTQEAFNAIHSDPQLANRFHPLVLHKWIMSREYLKLLASFEAMLPLRKPSNLTNNKLPDKILAMSEGTIGEITYLLRLAAIDAIRSENEFISQSSLESIGWVSPSDRKMKIPMMDALSSR